MLELQNVSFQVDAEGKDKEIIRNISLTVPEKKLVVVTGPNGGGKSTLAKLIAGIEKPSEIAAGKSFTGVIFPLSAQVVKSFKISLSYN